MSMRLNLGSILKSQMPPHGSNSYSLSSPTAREKVALRHGADQDNYFPEKVDVKSRVHSMMANIHKHMKIVSPPRKAVPTIPAAIAEIPSPPSVTRSVGSRRSRRIKGGGSSGKPGIMPISQIKAKLNRQSQQVMKRGYSEIGAKSFTNQRRIREVLLQKTVLENMLLQHKRLQRDRQTIALDIQRMRQDLDRIKNKLDTSMQALNSTRTLYSGFAKGKKLAANSILPTNVANETADSAQSNVGKLTGSKSKKLGNITMKKQHFGTTKRRVRA